MLITNISEKCVPQVSSYVPFGSVESPARHFFFLVNVKLNVSIFLCYLSQIFVALQWVCICIYFFISSWHDKWLLGSSECILVSFRPLSHCFYPPFSNASFLLQKLLYPLRGEHFKASAV